MSPLQENSTNAPISAARRIADTVPVRLASARQSAAQARARYDAGLTGIVDVVAAERVLADAEADAALASDRWQERVAGLKAIRERNGDVTASPAYARMLASPYPQERYWLARALGVSPNPAAFIDLVGLLDDPQINVRTMALEALAQRRNPRAVDPILKLLKTSDDWYDQLYAYQALRTHLRWDQTRLH